MFSWPQWTRREKIYSLETKKKQLISIGVKADWISEINDTTTLDKLLKPIHLQNIKSLKHINDQHTTDSSTDAVKAYIKSILRPTMTAPDAYLWPSRTITTSYSGHRNNTVILPHDHCPLQDDTNNLELNFLKTKERFLNTLKEKLDSLLRNTQKEISPKNHGNKLGEVVNDYSENAIKIFLKEIKSVNNMEEKFYEAAISVLLDQVMYGVVKIFGDLARHTDDALEDVWKNAAGNMADSLYGGDIALSNKFKEFMTKGNDLFDRVPDESIETTLGGEKQNWEGRIRTKLNPGMSLLFGAGALSFSSVKSDEGFAALDRYS